MFQKLPEEIILKILGFLPHLDLLYISTTCSRIRRASYSLFYRLQLQLPNPEIQSCCSRWKSWKFSHVTLDMSRMDSYIESDEMDLIGASTELEIINGPEEWEQHFKADLSHLKNVRRLTIRNSICKVDTFCEFYSNKQIEFVFMKSQIHFGTNENCFTGLKADILLGNRSIKIVNCLRISHEITGFLISSLHKNCASVLTDIHLDGAQISNVEVHNIQKSFPNLSNLSLNNCFNLTSASINSIGKMTKLQSLSIAGLKEVKSIFALSSCRSLCSLDVSHCTQLNDITILAETIQNFKSLHVAAIPARLEVLAVTTLDNLEELNVSNCYQVSESLLSSMYLPKMKSLNLCGCVRVTDEMLHSVVCKAGLLVDLNLSWLKKISSSFFQNTAAESLLFQRVEKLYLSNTNITNECLEVIASCRPNALQTLHINMCRNITDEGILYLTCVSSLQDLDLSHLCHITNRGLNRLCASLERLKTLRIVGCTSISDYGIAGLKNCRRLTTFECTQCPLLTTEGVEGIVDTLPRLHTVVFVKKIM